MESVLLVAAAAVLLIAVEQLAPGVRQPRVPGWLLRVLSLNLAQAAVIYVGLCSWDRWLPQWQLWDAASLGLGWGIVLGYLAITFVFVFGAQRELQLLRMLSGRAPQ